MTALAAAYSLVILALKRLRSEPWLALGTLLGLIIAISLTVSVPIYTEAANNQLLREELVSMDESLAIPFMYRVINTAGKVRAPDVDAADDLLTNLAPALVHLPLRVASISIQSAYFGLYPSSEGFYSSRREDLGRTKLGCIRQLGDHATLVEGQWPAAIDRELGGRIDVLVAESKALEIGLQVGEEYTLFRGIETTTRDEVAVRIVGIWRPTDHSEPYWFLSPEVYDDVMLLPEESYRYFASGQVEASQVYYNYIAWYQLYDGSSLNADQVPRILRGMSILRTRVSTIIPAISFSVSPEDSLLRHQEAVKLQTNLMLAFGLPIIALVLFFSAFIAKITATQRVGEVAMLRSRGYGVDHIVLLSIIQCLILALVALVLGLALGREVARQLGNTKSFLSFTARAPLAVRITPSSIRTGLAISLLTVVLSVAPDLRSAQLSAVGYWRRTARMTERPWWQRYYVDIGLLVAVGYGYYLISKGRGMAFLIGGRTNPLENPVVLITPFLFMVVAVMVFLRLAPILFRLGAAIAGLFSGLVPVLTLRHLERSSSNYGGVMLLLALSVSLSLFVASMAWTLDKNMIDRTYYETGADLNLDERGWMAPGAGSGVSLSDPGTSSSTSDTSTNTSQDDLASAYAIIPIDEAEEISQVRGAMRIYRGSVSIRSGEGPAKGTLVGVERARVPGIAFFRSDFAPRSLGELMNSLALHRDGILVAPDLLAATGLGIGDRLLVQMDISRASMIEFTIVGQIRMFPTVYRADFPLLVANLDYVIEQVGWPLTGEIWLSVDPDSEAAKITAGLEDLGFQLRTVTDARGLVSDEQSQLLRVGLFGFLSAGFIAASGLSVLSLLIYSFVSFKQRYVQFGILHAIGLTKAQLERLFVFEQCLIIGLGTAVGTLLGFASCHLFLEFFQVSTTEVEPLPPLLVEIAMHDIWKTYIVLGLSLLILAIGTLRLLKGLRMFEAIKLGTQLTG